MSHPSQYASANGNGPVVDLEQQNADLNREVELLLSDLEDRDLDLSILRSQLREWRWQQHGGNAAFAIRRADPAKMRPTEHVWNPWIVRGRLNEIVGEERAGKSTFQAFIAAEVSNGRLPGTFHGQPRDVLFIGCDEDSWETDTMPRLWAAGADFGRIHVFDGGPFNVERDADALAKLLKGDTTFGPEPVTYGLIVIEHAMDVLPLMRNYNDPAAMRRVTHSFRHVLRELDVAALWTRHTNKGRTGEFRDAAQGSMQFGAMARSSFLIARHPSDEDRRVAVLGPNNYVAEGETPALSFEIVNSPFTENGHLFNPGRVADIEQEDLTMYEVLSGGPSRTERERDERIEKIVDNLTAEGQSVRDLAKATGISKSAVDRLLKDYLEPRGEAAQSEDGWVSHCPSP